MLENFLAGAREVLSTLTQRSVWVLIVPALAVLAWIDMPMVLTLLQWSAFAVILAGLSIVVSMITFPQVRLTKLVERAYLGCEASARVASALIIFFGILFFSLVFWAKT